MCQHQLKVCTINQDCFSVHQLQLGTQLFREETDAQNQARDQVAKGTEISNKAAGYGRIKVRVKPESESMGSGSLKIGIVKIRQGLRIYKAVHSKDPK